VEAGGERIKIMAGSGVNSKNAADVIAQTGVHEIHASAKARVPSPMRFQRNVSMGSTGGEEYMRSVANEGEVRALARILAERDQK